MAGGDLTASSVGSKSATDLTPRGDMSNHSRMFLDAEGLVSPKLTKAVPATAMAAGVSIKRPRGRPAGSKNKPKPPIIITRDSANALRAHAMEVGNGCDICESLANFARRRQSGIYILSGTGCVMNVTLRQPATSGAIVTLHGRFEILSLLGSILPPPAPPGITGLTIYLAGPQGQVVGGGVVGSLISSGSVVIMAASFMNATFDRLPLDDDEVSAAAHNQHHLNNHQYHNLHHADLSNLYGIPQNLLSNGAFRKWFELESKWSLDPLSHLEVGMIILHLTTLITAGLMKNNNSSIADDRSASGSNKMKKTENHKNHFNRDVTPGTELWTDGLICAFEFVRGRRKTSRTKYGPKIQSTQQIEREDLNKHELRYGPTDASAPKMNRSNMLEPASFVELGRSETFPLDDYTDTVNHHSGHFHSMERFPGNQWIPIGWSRISELVQTVQADASWASQPIELTDDEDDLSVADVAAPYWEPPAGPTWWCHVAAGHQFVDTWLTNAEWLHPAISIALRDESRLISERMKHLLYEVPVRVAGGLLFELLGQSAGDPTVDEDDIPVVLRSWQARKFLITALHIKGSASNINVLGIAEVQELLAAGGMNAPRTVHEVIAHLACRLSRWDDRLFRKSIFGEADEVELKFMNRRNLEDMNLFSIILNQEIRRLSRQVIRVKWSLHAREEIVFELLQHLRGTAAKNLLEGVRKSTREMIGEQEAVRGRLFTIQDVMQGTVRAWLQDRSLRVTHNLAVFGGCGLVLSIITGLFGINVDGIPGSDNTPYAFGLFAALLLVLGVVLIGVGLLSLGLKEPVNEERVEVRKLELKELVKMFQHEAETHAQVRQDYSRRNLTPTSGERLQDGTPYFLIG
ncbi:hypothetical protein NE237_032176 [Protea cynaroides]|uniref:PPC domain-containing protein n=1 Tax=Protea cynaroides TaxID=273540 RepID=A0A9Q0L3R8_9MAGN|nr:hypothetical protein NE237_032176 [Protea cynaroides]